MVYHLTTSFCFAGDRNRKLGLHEPVEATDTGPKKFDRWGETAGVDGVRLTQREEGGHS